MIRTRAKAVSATRGEPVTLSRPPPVAPLGCPEVDGGVLVGVPDGAVVVVVEPGVGRVVVVDGAVVVVDGAVVVVDGAVVDVVVGDEDAGTRALDGPERTGGPGTIGSAAAKASLPTEPASTSAWVRV